MMPQRWQDSRAVYGTRFTWQATQSVWICQRCASWVDDYIKHARWHLELDAGRVNPD